MQIEFLSTIAVIAADPPESRGLYIDALGLPLRNEEDEEYFHSDELSGCRHFAVWPLTQAAQACFGAPSWPEDRRVPQVSLEFDVANVEGVQAAADELVAAGHELLHPARMEPWGQTVVRLQSPEGAIVGISHIPAFHT